MEMGASLGFLGMSLGRALQLGRLIAQAVTGDAFYFNKTLLLSGPEAISLSQLA